MTIDAALDRLEQVLKQRTGALAVAVSGGVDSLTLMALAHRLREGGALAVHAVSPAVPPEATARVRRLSAERDWRLSELNAGEFDDPAYLANPVNRCFYCKHNLFTAMSAALPDSVLATGTNTDDLGDFRPGLEAAKQHGVWQPLVEAGIDKPTIRALAKHEGLPYIAALPAQPCLSSRIETGIAVTAPDLGFVHSVETTLTARLGPGDHRCRITARGVEAQTAMSHPSLADRSVRAALEQELAALCERAGRSFLGLMPYRRGSAFLRDREAHSVERVK